MKKLILMCSLFSVCFAGSAFARQVAYLTPGQVVKVEDFNPGVNFACGEAQTTPVVGNGNSVIFTLFGFGMHHMAHINVHNLVKPNQVKPGDQVVCDVGSTDTCMYYPAASMICKGEETISSHPATAHNWEQMLNHADTQAAIQNGKCPNVVTAVSVYPTCWPE